MARVVLLSVPHSGTHFMRRTLDWLGVEHETWHIHPAGGWCQRGGTNDISQGTWISPLRDPLLTWITCIERSGDEDWRRKIERGHRVYWLPMMGVNGNVEAWDAFFKRDVAAYVRIDGIEADRVRDLRNLIAFLGVETPTDLAGYVEQWGLYRLRDDHELKHAYFARDVEALKVVIDQVRPIAPYFRALGYDLWWDE